MNETDIRTTELALILFFPGKSNLYKI